MRGLEPPRTEAQRDLNPSRLPISPHPRFGQDRQEQSAADAGLAGVGRNGPSVEVNPSKVRRTFDGKSRLPISPHPRVLRLKDRAAGNARTITDRDDRERESQESEELLLVRRQREEQEHRHEIAERLQGEEADEPDVEG